MFAKMQTTQTQIAQEMNEEYKLRGKRVLEAQQEHFTMKLRSYQTQLENERMLFDVLVDMHGPILHQSHDQKNPLLRPTPERGVIESGRKGGRVGTTLVASNAIVKDIIAY